MIGKDEKTQKPFSFVYFEKEEHAFAALEATNNKDVFKSGE